MKFPKELVLPLKDCKILIISVVFSFISYILGLIILFYKFKFEILTYIISIIYILFILSSFIRISYKENKNIKSFLGKTNYYICCSLLTIFSFFIIQNLQFS